VAFLSNRGGAGKIGSHSVYAASVPVVDDVVRAEDLTVRFGARVALAGADLSIPSGVTTAVIGPNGSGKSTLLSAIAGLVKPSAGAIAVTATDIALVLQSTEVDPRVPITVREVVRMARYPHRGMLRRMRRNDNDVVDASMARTRVADLASRQLHELSGGQRQRVFVAQGLAQQADLLLLDEPMTGLDITSRRILGDVIEEERAAGRTVVMTTHSLEDAATCDVVVLLSGRVVAVGPPREIIEAALLEEAFGGVLQLPGGQLVVEHAHHHDVA
jgi:manganese transport system ATP-binding protein